MRPRRGRLQGSAPPQAGIKRRDSARRNPAREQVPGQGVEPRSPRSERGVLPVRRSRKGRRLHPCPRAGTSMQRQTSSVSLASCVSLDQAERCCPSHSPTLRPWITDRRMRYPGWTTSYVEELWSPSLAHVAGNRQAKAGAKYQHPFLSPCGRSLSPSGGASIRSRPSSSWASPRFVSVGHLQKRRRRPGWVALARAAMRLDG